MSNNQVDAEIEELTDVVGPGSLLSEARKKLNLSVEDVASRLNFRSVLVENIELDVFDKSLPDTYNRGYLKNYAKLVGLSPESIIESYENLNLLQENHAKMQSFSRSTFKRAQNSMLMWITYAILAVFVGLTMMWWLQDNNGSSLSQSDLHIEQTKEVLPEPSSVEPVENPDNTNSDNLANVEVTSEEAQSVQNTESIIDNAKEESNVQISALESTAIDTQAAAIDLPITTVFSFSGDCWVNIYDSTGERIAWGIKKAGYVMTIEGKPPLNVTIGKPELVEINFNGERIDMSAFREGHISKFTLPLSPETT